MVPVPEELRDAVDRFLMQRDIQSRAAQQELDRDAILEFLSHVDARSVAVLRLASVATDKGEDVSVAEVAAMLKLTDLETVGLLHELSEVVAATFGPLVGIWAAPNTKQASVDWATRTIYVAAPLARLIVDAEAHPTGSQQQD
jgi:hypothetical protein